LSRSVNSTEHNPTETRPWMKPQAKPRTQVADVQRRLLNEPDGKAFLFALLCDAGAFDQQPTPQTFGAQLLSRLIAIDALGVGAMWAEGMTTLHAERVEKAETNEKKP
jgi:hypothetical protein